MYNQYIIKNLKAVTRHLYKTANRYLHFYNITLQSNK